MFATGEAIANAIEHSHASDPICIECFTDGGKIMAEITDTGCGIERVPENPHLPSPFAERGRGLAIMARCTDMFSVESHPGRGTKVRLGRFLTPVNGKSKPA
jgi:stage II sporulation protein AB (anti-sigma F factor)